MVENCGKYATNNHQGIFMKEFLKINEYKLNKLNHLCTSFKAADTRKVVKGVHHFK